MLSFYSSLSTPPSPLWVLVTVVVRYCCCLHSVGCSLSLTDRRACSVFLLAIVSCSSYLIASVFMLEGSGAAVRLPFRIFICPPTDWLHSIDDKSHNHSLLNKPRCHNTCHTRSCLTHRNNNPTPPISSRLNKINGAFDHSHSCTGPRVRRLLRRRQGGRGKDEIDDLKLTYAEPAELYHMLCPTCRCILTLWVVPCVGASIAKDRVGEVTRSGCRGRPRILGRRQVRNVQRKPDKWQDVYVCSV